MYILKVCFGTNCCNVQNKCCKSFSSAYQFKKCLTQFQYLSPKDILKDADKDFCVELQVHGVLDILDKSIV